jgi:hypothetical protein
MPQSTLVGTPGTKVFRGSTQRPLPFIFGNRRTHGNGHSLGDLVLNRENIDEFAIVAVIMKASRPTFSVEQTIKFGLAINPETAKALDMVTLSLRTRVKRGDRIISYELCCTRSGLFLALGRKSRRCNNFDSYVWFNRHGERVDFMPGFDPSRNSLSRCSKCPSTLCEII